MKARRLAPVLAALLLARPGGLRAWSAHGHRVVALIAQDRLSEAARAGVAAILGPGVTLEGISVCADYLRGDLSEDPRDDPKGSGAVDHAGHTVSCGGIVWQEEGQSRPWHYLNAPIGDSPADAAALKAYCPDSACVMEQIGLDARVLSDPAASQADKRRALMFLAHFVGDEHQPLHCATELVSGSDDRGGNLKWVRFYNNKLRLHSLWDHAIEVKDSLDPSALSRLLEGEIAGKDASSWTSGDFTAAAAFESFKLSQEVVYPHYYGDDSQNLGEDYKNLMQPLAFERLEKAGVRLAALLETALGPSRGGAARLISPESVSERIGALLPPDGRLDW